MAAAETLAMRLSEYGQRVSWAVDRKEEIKRIKEFRKLVNAISPGDNFRFGNREAVLAGMKAGKNIGLHKQAGIEETKLIGA